MSSKFIPHGNVKLLVGRSQRTRGGAIKFDFWGALKKFGDVVQTVIDKAAPIVSKAVGPVASAVTGLPLTPVISAAQNHFNSQNTNGTLSKTSDVPADVLPILQQIMNKGKGVKIKKKKKGKGFNIL